MSTVKLTAESQSYLDLTRGTSIDLTLPVADLRESSENTAAKFRGDFVYNGKKEEAPITNNGVNVPAVILRPSVISDTWDQIMVFFHGGGWVWGSITTHMAFCEMVSQACSCVVVNVEYRLAPENKFPACYEDAENVVRWCLDNKVKLAGNDKALLGVAGDSAGGNIAASVCHLVNSIDYQVLIYPSFHMSAELYDSYSAYSEGFLLTQTLMSWFRGKFFNSKEEKNLELSSPILRSSFKGLPPALFIVAQCDPLADQSSAYKEKLDKAGVKSELKLLTGTVHGFITKPGHFKETTRTAVQHIENFLMKLK